jgi:hypothetical protein
LTNPSGLHRMRGSKTARRPGQPGKKEHLSGESGN